MAEASCEDFQLVVKAHIGFLSISAARTLSTSRGHGLLEQLDDAATTCISKFNELRLTGNWSGASNKVSAFKAALQGSSPSGIPYVRGMSQADWLKWFDSSECGVCGKRLAILPSIMAIARLAVVARRNGKHFGRSSMRIGLAAVVVVVARHAVLHLVLLLAFVLPQPSQSSRGKCIMPCSSL